MSAKNNLEGLIHERNSYVEMFISAVSFAPSCFCTVPLVPYECLDEFPSPDVLYKIFLFGGIVEVVI